MESKRSEYSAKIVNAGANLSQAKLFLLQAAIASPSSQASARLRKLASAAGDLVHHLQSIARAPEPPCSNSGLANKTQGWSDGDSKTRVVQDGRCQVSL
jgi:hypothetical protein